MNQTLYIAAGGFCLALAAYVLFKKFKVSKFLKSDQKLSVTLIEKEHLTHDTRRFRFALPENHVLGLPIGKYIFVSATIDGKLVSRPYTPVTSDDDVGYFDCVIKVYFPPKGGVMTQHLESLKLGDSVDIRGPIGRIEYTGNGAFLVSSSTAGSVTKTASHIGMICGGSGITPCLQVIRDILKKPTDNTQISLLFANQTEEDILLRKELESCAAQHANFKFWYTVDRAPSSGWKYSTGFISEEMIREHMPSGKDCLYLLCGPAPMIKFACLPNLEKCGVVEDRILTF